MNAKYVFENATTNHDEIVGYLGNLDVYRFEVLEDFYREIMSGLYLFDLPDFVPFDVCGTGGSGRERVNLSTAMAIKLSKDFTITKYVNRAASGRFGSYDVLEHMGHDVAHSPDDVLRGVKNNNMAFLFAPAFNVKLSAVAGIRRDVGCPTVFNLVVPMTNPARNISGQFMGVYDRKAMPIMADLAASVDKNVLFVHDVDNGLDDVSITGETDIIEVFDGKISSYTVVPEDFGIARVSSFEKITGHKSLEQNARLVKDMLAGLAPEAYLKFLNINIAIATNFFEKCKRRSL